MSASSFFQFTEQHHSPVYAVAFNQCDEEHLSVFATVGANYANIYRIEDPVEATPEETDTCTNPDRDSPVSSAPAPRRSVKIGMPNNKSRSKRQRVVAKTFTSQIVALQAYRDEDEDETEPDELTQSPGGSSSRCRAMCIEPHNA